MAAYEKYSETKKWHIMETKKSSLLHVTIDVEFCSPLLTK